METRGSIKKISADEEITMNQDILNGERLSDKMNREYCRSCGNCKYHQYENVSQGWVCCNPDSDYVADWTEYDFCCGEWEERERDGR